MAHLRSLSDLDHLPIIFPCNPVTLVFDDGRYREDMTKIKEYVNIQLGKHYHLFTLQKYNPKELQNNLNDTRSK